ncbi:squalene monooxygenase-like [Strongylocentrotus purpuratus]|uniref:Squalene monooxygenase n=1 Tax=Strongylocentrotus purpuratus TaxID=7668 RepID=A0A7M7N425_STRPU|nr:squalene monooxygenase-like [Strongylocentrotus purpuratus]
MEFVAGITIASLVLVLILSLPYILGGFLGLRGVTKMKRISGRQTHQRKLTGNANGALNSSPEVIIVGSGIMGSVMATVLARDGRKVTVFERDMRQPDRIVGETIHPGGIETLAKLGLTDCLSGFGANRLDGMVIHDPNTKKPLDFQYPRDKTERIRVGYSFHYGRFVMSLRKAAMAENNVTYIEATVTNLLEEKHRIVGVEYKNKGEQTMNTLKAPLTVIADGAFSNFRKQFSTLNDEILTKPSSYFLGMRIKKTSDFKDNHIEGFWCNSIAGVSYRTCPETVRLLALFGTNKPQNLQQLVMETIVPELPDHYKEVVGPALEAGSVRLRLIPAYYIPSAPLLKPGIMLLGDALSSRSAITGSGITSGLKDIQLWTDILKEMDSLDDDEAMAESLNWFQKKRRSSHALAINVLAQCIQTVLLSKDRYLSKFRLGAFHYVMSGGECLDGPLRIFSCLEPRPGLLLYHFLRVNLYTAYYLLKSAPWYAKPLALLDGPLVFIRSSLMFFSLWFAESKAVKN